MINAILGVVAADDFRVRQPEGASLLGDALVPVVLSTRLALAGLLGWLIVFRANNVANG